MMCCSYHRQLLKRLSTKLTVLVWATNRSRCIPPSCSSRSLTWQTSTQCTSTHSRGSSTSSWCLLTKLSVPRSSRRDWWTSRITSLTHSTATSVGRSLKRTRYSTPYSTRSSPGICLCQLCWRMLTLAGWMSNSNNEIKRCCVRVSVCKLRFSVLHNYKSPSSSISCQVCCCSDVLYPNV